MIPFLIPLAFAVVSIFPSVMIFPTNACDEFMQQCNVDNSTCTCQHNNLFSTIIPLGTFFGTMVFLEKRKNKDKQIKNENR